MVIQAKPLEVHFGNRHSGAHSTR